MIVESGLTDSEGQKRTGGEERRIER